MKFVLKEGLLKKISDFFSVTAIVLAVLGFFNLENWLLRISMQGSLSLTMLFRGMHTISNQKEKDKSGYLSFGVATFIFFVMIYTIVVGFKIGVL